MAIRHLAAIATLAAVACGGDEARPAPPSGAAPDAGAPAACVDGRPAEAYPRGPYAIEILGVLPPDLSFTGESGAPVRLADLYDPCAGRPKLLIVRSSAAWCGPCRWQAAHTGRFLRDPAFADRLVLVDLLIADEDNLPATPSGLGPWKTAIDTPDRLAVDPQYRFGAAFVPRGPLPGIVLVDTRTMKLLTTLNDPDPETFANRLAIELADLDKAPRPAFLQPTRFDGHFTENQIDQIRAMKLVAAPPPDPTNAFADSPAAAALGKLLFSDTALGPAGVSCATCHPPAKDLSDGLPQSTGIRRGDRNAPPVALAAHARWQFWDGRADTLWMQALLPIEDAAEIGSSRVELAHRIASAHATAYDAAFGASHPLPAALIAGLPPTGKPGDTGYDALAPATRDAVTRVYVNAGKAIAAFERTLRVEPNALDRYAAGDLAALDDAQKSSLEAFFTNGCAQCHWGPRLTNDAFHNVRFGTGRTDGAADPGRETGLTRLAAAEFLASSKWSDAPASAKPFPLAAAAPTTLGTFKTPTLRGLPTSAPYGHGGTLATLAELTKQYGERGLEHADPRAIGSTEQWVPNFDKGAQEKLVPFLEVLTGKLVLP